MLDRSLDRQHVGQLPARLLPRSGSVDVTPFYPEFAAIRRTGAGSEGCHRGNQAPRPQQ